MSSVSKLLTAETIADVLHVARSNVSTSLRELQSWGLVKMTHVEGDRRDHFDAHKDVREIFRVVMEERKKRELDPTLAVLRDCVNDAANDTPKAVRERMAAAAEEQLARWAAAPRGVPQAIDRDMTDTTFRVLIDVMFSGDGRGEAAAVEICDAHPASSGFGFLTMAR